MKTFYQSLRQMHVMVLCWTPEGSIWYWSGGRWTIDFETVFTTIWYI